MSFYYIIWSALSSLGKALYYNLITCYYLPIQHQNICFCLPGICNFQSMDNLSGNKAQFNCNRANWDVRRLFPHCEYVVSLLVVSFSTPQVFPGSWWATGFILLSSGRCPRSKRELTQRRTAWPSSRSARCATSTSLSPSLSFHALCWWGTEWRSSGGLTEVSSSICGFNIVPL